MIKYIRFGILPENGKSYNRLTELYEKGISVYKTIYKNGTYNIIMPSTLPHACITLYFLLPGKIVPYNYRLYEIKGKIIGNGGDGEPLMTNCKEIYELVIDEDEDKIKRVKKREFINKIKLLINPTCNIIKYIDCGRFIKNK
jgi:hypothetical protein